LRKGFGNKKKKSFKDALKEYLVTQKMFILPLPTQSYKIILLCDFYLSNKKQVFIFMKERERDWKDLYQNVTHEYV
jgi:hypothetical protein